MNIYGGEAKIHNNSHYRGIWRMSDGTKVEEMFPEWCARTNAEIDRKNAEQAFINRIIGSFYGADPFRNCPDRDQLDEIAELAVRLIHSCDKTIGDDGTGIVHGFGIKGKFMEAVRRYGREQDLKEIRSDLRRRDRIKKLREENRELKAHRISGRKSST